MPEGGIDTVDNMLEIAQRVTESVVCGLLTIEEAEKLTECLKQQRWLIDKAVRKKESEVRDME